LQKDRYFDDDDFEIAAAAQKVAKEHGVISTQIACAWILQASGVTSPIIGATKTVHSKQIFEAVEIKLSAEETAALEKCLYHPTHPAIFAGFLTMARNYGKSLKLKLQHKVSVLPSAGQVFEYLNCHPEIGMPPYFSSSEIPT
jgi:hypothetical protein